MSRFLRPIAVMAALAVPLLADTRLKISSVHPEYTPIAGSQRPEPVSMERFSFEIEKETGRARIVIEYTYPNRPAFGFDGGAGPEPSTAQIPGLRYDETSRSVVFDVAGKRAVCATVRNSKRLLWNRSSIVPTGACKVSSQLSYQAEDSGWRIRRFHTLHTFFEVDSDRTLSKRR